MDVPALLNSAGGFVGTLGARVQSSDRTGSHLRLDAGPELHNHIGGPHAAAIFGLGETAAFALLLEVFGDLVEAGTALPLIKSGRIDYSAIATGPLLADARLVDDEAAARASLAERGVASFDIEIVFRREADDVQTAVMTARMALKAVNQQQPPRV
jgi:acyl-coenzyme A thioesterase PaaI-like protein